MARRRGNKRRKVCYFTANKIEYIDYKDVDLLRKFGRLFQVFLLWIQGMEDGSTRTRGLAIE